MTYTYLGNKSKREWMPLATANALDDVKHNVKEGQLYRWRVSPANALLYKCGKLLAFLGMTI
jgi:hypothetical protein